MAVHCRQTAKHQTGCIRQTRKQQQRKTTARGRSRIKIPYKNRQCGAASTNVSNAAAASLRRELNSPTQHNVRNLLQLPQLAALSLQCNQKNQATRPDQTRKDETRTSCVSERRPRNYRRRRGYDLCLQAAQRVLQGSGRYCLSSRQGAAHFRWPTTGTNN